MNALFKLPDGDNRTPHEIALDWLISQNLKPGDVILAADVETAMGLVNPNTLARGRKHQRAWDLARLSVLYPLLQSYQTQTGAVLKTVRGMGWKVCHPNEVGDFITSRLYGDMYDGMRKALTLLKHASKDDASNEELQKRNDAVSKISSLRSFMTRERRKRLTD